MFNIILDEVPKEYNGAKLKTDFRQVFKFFRLQEDEDLTDREKTSLAFYCFFEDEVPHTQEYMDFIAYYIRGGEEPSDDTDGETVFDWLKDSTYLYAAFLQVYKIDLSSVKLHWWHFLALYKGIPEGTKLGDVIQTRLTPIPKADKSNQGYISSLVKLKKYYALDKKDTEIGSQVQDFFGRL